MQTSLLLLHHALLHTTYSEDKPAAPTTLVAARLLHDGAEVPPTHEAAATRRTKDGIRGRGGQRGLLGAGNLTRNYRHIKCEIYNGNIRGSVD